MFKSLLLSRLRPIAGALVLFAFASFAAATDYYVDATKGDDSAKGTSPKTAWKTLDRVSSAEELAPGDVVKFKRGEIWRGGLSPRSGEPNKPITYTSYGDGAKPSFWRSIALDKESDWLPVGENLWATRPTSVRKIGGAGKFMSGGKWFLHQESGAKVVASTEKSASGKETRVFACESCGTASNHIQWCYSSFPIQKGKRYRLSMNVKSTKPISFSARLMKSEAPWTGYGEVVCGKFESTPEFSRQSIVFKTTTDADDARVTFYLGGLPSDVTITIADVEAEEVAVDAFDFGTDVGNIILDGSKAAFKRWTLDDLKAQDDFCYEKQEGRVWLYSKENPAKVYKTLEAATMRHVINHSGVHDVIFDGLDVRYGAAHGFGGTGSRNMIIRNCDVCWIGGGDQYGEGGTGRRVRYGNGIEFWAAAENNVVENCRFWEIYDAALTNQGSGENVERDIVYRNNLIWNCEYSFEYWNRDERSKTENVSFVDNVCLQAGYGWGHVQRPDKNGRCLMFYSNTAQTKNFVVKGNVFANATESLVRSDIEWTPEQPNLTENVYWQDDKELPYFMWLKEKYFEKDFDAWRDLTGQEKGATVKKIDVKTLIPDVK
ncbi:MAG: carbohydrate binding domain-containing protein [Thermoguttaceae bacterium]|nr:carbohydrate binding domain-containing protein [Thermoguttaceae bacterium]